MILLMKMTVLTTFTALMLMLTGCSSNEAPPDMSKYKLNAELEFCTVTHVNVAQRYVVSRLPKKLPPPEPGDFVMIYRPARAEMYAAFIGVVGAIATDGMSVTFTVGEDAELPRIRDLIEIRKVPLTTVELKRKLGAR